MGLARSGNHILNRKVIESKLLLLHEHLVLRQLAADHRDLGNAGNGKQLPSKIELRVRPQLQRRDGPVNR